MNSHSPTLLVLLSALSLTLGAREPTYKMLGSYNVADYTFDVKKYDPSVAIETCGRSRNAFSLLAGYIGVTGAPRNIRREKIAMTAPVVNYQKTNGPMCMQFILPQWIYGGDVEKAPEPFDSQVKVVPREMVMATYTYYGYADIAVHAEKLKKLMAAVEEMAEKDDFKWKIANPTHFEGNGFSGPWTPWSMRKNEVAIQLVPKQ